MKKCPYCAEEIQDEAIYCKYCHHDIKDKRNSPAETIILNDYENKMSFKGILFSFRGRVGRGIFWLGFVGMMFLLFVIETILKYLQYRIEGWAIGIISVVLYGFFIWIWLAVFIKRCHDQNKSGLWILVSCIPIIGPFWVLFGLGFTEGTSGPNKYG